MLNKKGFTLIELLAVIVVLAIILAIAVPGISNVIKSSTKTSFGSDAKLVLKAVDYKKLKDETFDITLINKNNITDLLNISSENYSSVDVVLVNGNTYIKLVGQGKWEGLTACGIYKNIDVVEDGNCGPDYISPDVSLLPDGSENYIKSSTVTINVTDESLNEASLKYVWTDNDTIPGDDEYTNTFTNGSSIAMPTGSGTFYLHVIARDTMNNITRIIKKFNLDNEKPIISLNGDSSITILKGSIYVDAGATVSDNIDENIGSKLIATGTVNPNVTGTYTLTYNATDEAGNAAITITRTISVIESTYTFSYTGSSQTWTVPSTGIYKLEVWGAQGANGGCNAAGGKGAYTYGNKTLNKGDIVYIYVGGQGGYNGGGSGGTSTYDPHGNGAHKRGGNGGGATDMRLGGTALTNRIIVAGGGGGGGGTGNTWDCGEGMGGQGGAGGGGNGLTGGTASYGSPGAGGAYAGGSSGQGSVGGTNTGGAGGGGGGGYIGGAGGGAGTSHTGCGGSCGGGGGGGGGGSSYNTGLTSTGGSSGVRTGNGDVKITYIGQ